MAYICSAKEMLEYIISTNKIKKNFAIYFWRSGI